MASSERNATRTEHPAPRPTTGLCLADGVELIGEYEGSGFKEPAYLARRADGQVIQLSRLLYLVASHADGRRAAEEISAGVSQEFGRTVSAENVEYLARERLQPLGLLEPEDGSAPEAPRVRPFLALNLRVALVPEGAVRAVTSLLWPLFLPPVVLAVLVGLAALDWWLFFVHGLGGAAREAIYRPGWFLAVMALIVVATAFHECGHAAACRYGGARPGTIGVGLYLVWPVFYNDVSDTYRLGRVGRLRADLGGVYFNVVFSLALAGAYLATGLEPLLLVILLVQMEILHQFLPFLRLDGYYVVSDLTGVPDLFSRIKPILRSMVPGRPADERVDELKPWVRVAVTAWVVTVIPVLAALFAMLVAGTPLFFATARDSLLLHYTDLQEALDEGRATAATATLLRMVLLCVPVAGISLTFALIGRGLARLAWRASARKPLLRTAYALAVTAAVVALAVARSGAGGEGPVARVSGPAPAANVAPATPSAGDAGSGLEEERASNVTDARRCTEGRIRCAERFVASIAPEAEYAGDDLGGETDVLYFADPTMELCEYTIVESRFWNADRTTAYTVIIAARASYAQGREPGCLPDS